MAGSFCWQDEVLWECTQGFRNEPFGPSQPPVRRDREVEAHAASPVSRGAGWGGVTCALCQDRWPRRAPSLRRPCWFPAVRSLSPECELLTLVTTISRESVGVRASLVRSESEFTTRTLTAQLC